MKGTELRAKSEEELQELLKGLLRDQFKLRIKHANQDESVKTNKFKEIRRNIARVKTILTEKKAVNN